MVDGTHCTNFVILCNFISSGKSKLLIDKGHALLRQELGRKMVAPPNYKNGEQVALIRYPHGGTFEIPVLTVNNKQPEGNCQYNSSVLHVP